MENTTRNAPEVNKSTLQEVLTPPDNGRSRPPTHQGTGVAEAIQAPQRSPQPGRGDPSGAGSSRRAESGQRGVDAPKKRGTQFFVTLCHWSMVVLLGISLLSGMRAGWEFVDSPLGGADGAWSAMLHAIAPKATLFGVNLIVLHVMSVWFLLLTAGIYTIYMFRTGHKRRLRTGSRDFKSILKALQTGGFWSNKGALWSMNVLVYWVGFVSILVLIVTGLALYRVDWGWFDYLGGYGTVRFLHSLTAYFLVPYTILHGLLQWCFGTFWSIFKARFHRPLLTAGCIGAVVALPAVVGLYTRNEAPTTLVARYLAGDLPTPVLDGNPDDSIWGLSETVKITTAKGVNNLQDHVDIFVKALYDDQRVYFRLQWDDQDVSSKRFPLLKTPQGWKVLQTQKDQSDEIVYYEDKMSMYITDVANGSCAATCHMGAGAEGARKGVHYTAGEIGDVWHWKSVRTNPMGDLVGEPGFTDDQYFGPPDPRPDNPKKRYTAGYHADPKTGGGYRYNYVKLDPSKPLAETYVRPIKFPPVLETGKANIDPATSEPGIVWWIHDSQGIPYSEEADIYPVGTLIPNILIAPFQGDRADVRARGEWADGRWTLEISRQLDTKSKYDVAFTHEKPLYISIAVYNRAQTRHAEHIKPVRLVLQR